MYSSLFNSSFGLSLSEFMSAGTVPVFKSRLEELDKRDPNAFNKIRKLTKSKTHYSINLVKGRRAFIDPD